MTYGVSGVVGHAAQTVVLMLHAGRSGHSCYPALGGSQRIRWGTLPDSGTPSREASQQHLGMPMVQCPETGFESRMTPHD
jgi:hypothetical protein